MIWKDTYLSIQGLTADNAYQSKNQDIRSEELTAELLQDCVKAQIWRKTTNNSSALKVPNRTVASIILHWKNNGDSLGQTEQSEEPW